MECSSPPIAHAHDIFVRTVMSDLSIACEFFEEYLPPAILQTIDLKSLVLQPTSFINDIRQESTMDVLYKVRQHDPEGVMYLLVEHQSRPDPYMAVRIRRYIDNVIDYHLKNSDDKKVPMVYSFVLYHGRHPYPYSIDINDLVNARVEVKAEHFAGCRLIDLVRVADNQINKDSRIGLAKYVLKHIFDSDLLPFIIDAIDNMQTLINSGYGKYVLVVLQYIMERGEVGDIEAFYNFITSHITITAGETIMTIAELLRNKGLQEGLQKGLQKGVRQGIKVGLEKGIHQEKLETARRLLAVGAKHDLIMRITGLSLEAIIALEIPASI